MPESTVPESYAVPVAGGELAVIRWGAEGPVVLALHGITAHSGAFAFLAEALPDVRLVAPDLRGRGDSRALPGPWGLAAHADDAATVLRQAAPGERVVVVGHSMGAFVAAVLAHRHPGLVESVVLVDGGLPFASAELATTQAAVAAIRGRLETTYTPEGYRDFFRTHPAFARDWTPEVEAYADRDLVDGRASARLEAVLADQEDIESGTDLPAALAAWPRPTHLLHASRGFVDDPPGLYAQSTLAALRHAHPALTTTHVPDVNHYTIAMSRRGASAVAAAVRSVMRTPA